MVTGEKDCLPAVTARLGLRLSDYVLHCSDYVQHSVQHNQIQCYIVTDDVDSENTTRLGDIELIQRRPGACK